MKNSYLINESSFQTAWIQAVQKLDEHKWSFYNLIVQIEDVKKLDFEIHNKITKFARKINILSPKHVAYTVFPHNLYKRNNSSDKLFHAYNRRAGFYDRIKKHPRITWGTYFRRMTHYKQDDGEYVNQLDKVISALKNWEKSHKAAYTIVIPKPGTDTARPRGGPCLNYIVPQLVLINNSPSISLLCIYRNHDFLERAYGNYWALCNLTRFIADESDLNVGYLTCISSHAYIDKQKAQLKKLICEIS
ncbi:hypothetical protein ACFL6I_07085 [candidate division KSB1 bacterium]